MFQRAVLATAMIIFVGSSMVLAQQNSDAGNANPDPRGERGEYRPSAADMAAFTDARIAALRAGLELTPDQQQNWAAFEQSLRDVAQLHMQYVQAREAQRQEEQTPKPGQVPANPFPRLEQRADNLQKMSAALKKVADAGTPLYQSLTDAQKQRFMILAHMLRPHWMRRMMGGGMMGHGRIGGNGDQDSER